METPFKNIESLKQQKISLYMSAGTGASGGLGSDQPVDFTGLSQNSGLLT
jgi:hypothetical protein